MPSGVTGTACAATRRTPNTVSRVRGRMRDGTTRKRRTRLKRGYDYSLLSAVEKHVAALGSVVPFQDGNQGRREGEAGERGWERRKKW